MNLPMPPKSVLRQTIIADIVKHHRLDPDRFFSRSQLPELCAARKDAAHRLREAGFSKRRIGQILKRDRSTITFYFNPQMAERKRSRRRIYQLLESLAPDIRDIVGAISSAEQISPVTIITEWVNERARHEAAAKARAA